MYFVLVEGQYLVSDSSEYINLAKNLLDHQVFSSVLQSPLELNFFRTPGYPFFLVLCKVLGLGNPYVTVLIQEIIYCLSLFLFYRIGKPLFGEKMVRVSLLFLLIEPGGLTFPKLFYSETIFIPFLIIGIFLTGYYLKKFNSKYLMLSGFFLGVGIIIRPALQYFPLVIALTIITFNFNRKQCWVHSGVFLLIVALIISPWLIRNYHYSGKVFLSGQASNMFANYHVPLLWEQTKNMSFWDGQKIIKSRVKDSIQKKSQLLGRPLSKVEKFQAQKKEAFNALMQEPYIYARQWGAGTFRVIGGLHLPLLKTTLKIPRNIPFLHDIKENNFILQIWKYLKQQPVHVFFFLIIRGLLASLALLGALAIIKSRNNFLWIVMLLNFYFIIMAGPMADSRFRYPIKSFWIVQACYGFIWLSNRLKKYYLNDRAISSTR